MAYGKLAWLTKEELEDLYLVRHLTMQEIGDLYSTTRAGVKKAIDRAGIDTSTAINFEYRCAYCRTPFPTDRNRFRGPIGKYCKAEHYWKHKGKEV
jgi:hypothetical protein